MNHKTFAVDIDGTITENGGGRIQILPVRGKIQAVGLSGRGFAAPGVGPAIHCVPEFYIIRQ